MAKDLDGRVAVITAAGSGMGKEASLLFAREGAHVVVVDIDEPAANAVVEHITESGGSAQAMRVDMTDLAAVEAAVQRIDKEHGRLDVLWNHAGAPGPRGFDFDEAAWLRSVSLNLTAPIFMTKQALPLMRRSGAGGSMLFTSSVSGLIASRNSPVYSAVKSGVIGFMRCVAAIGAADGIRANAICPGSVETPMLTGFFQAPGESNEVLEQRLAAFRQSVPLGRACRPDEVAQLALFLASDRSSYITGVAIPIDGGYVAL
jgi:NAD(P)-dependent dehydrogenase (short-subunit alcohol dehydrogenase family)